MRNIWIDLDISLLTNLNLKISLNMHFSTSCNKDIPEQESSVGDPLESYVPRRLSPQEISAQVPVRGHSITKSAQEFMLNMEYTQRKFPSFDAEKSAEYPQRNFPSFDAEKSAAEFSDKDYILKGHHGTHTSASYSSSRYVEDTGLVNENTSGEIGRIVNSEMLNLPQPKDKYLPLSIHTEETHSDCRFSSSKGSGMGLLSIVGYECNIVSKISPREKEADRLISGHIPSPIPRQVFPSNEDVLDKRLVDIANQLLLVNAQKYTYSKDSDFVSYLSKNNVSGEYYRFYAERSPEKYDFAMNIMAYIELLNDSSWKATTSNFDANVKRMFQNIWNEKQAEFNNRIDVLGCNRATVLKMMLDFTQWSINRKFELEEFLYYCVLICQLGVVARKNIFREAPLYVIGQLRERMKFLKFKNLVHVLFEIVVKDYAKRLFKSSSV